MKMRTRWGLCWTLVLQEQKRQWWPLGFDQLLLLSGQQMRQERLLLK